MAPELRTDSMRVRMRPDETAMLRALAERQGLTASDIVRQLIRTAYAVAFGDRKPPRQKVIK